MSASIAKINNFADVHAVTTILAPTVVDNKITIRNNAKPQLPWKQKDIADEKLYIPMFKLAKRLNIHLVKYGGKEKEWGNFVEKLFNLDNFKNYEKLSVSAVRTQYDKRIAIFKKTFCCEDGAIGNINLGDRVISELDVIIRDMVVEQSLDNPRLQKSVEEEKNELNHTSETAILNQITNTSLHKKRKATDNTFTTSNESNSTDDIDRIIDVNKLHQHDTLNTTSSALKDLANAFKSIAAFATINNKHNDNKTLSTTEEINFSVERECEEKLLSKIDLIKEAMCQRLKLQGNDILLNIVDNLEVLINTYCAEGMKFNQFQIKQEFKNMLPDVDQMTIAQIFLIFEKVRKGHM